MRTRTILQQNGPDHLGLWFIGLSSIMMALITSDRGENAISEHPTGPFTTSGVVRWCPFSGIKTRIKLQMNLPVLRKVSHGLQPQSPYGESLLQL